MTINYVYLISFFSALALNLILTPGILLLSHRFKWYDITDHRKIHTEDIPRLGGVGIFAAFLISTLISLVVVSSKIETLAVTGLILRYVPVFGGLILVHMLGLLDDFRNLRAVWKFLIQIAAALLVTLGPFRITNIPIPFIWARIELGLFSYPLTVLWIVAISNAINLIDGIDGLAGGVTAIAAVFTAFIAMFVLENALLAVVALALVGSLIGFLVFNLPPARIFMGDSGSLTLGFVLAMFPLITENGDRSTMSLVPTITLLMIPILDTIGAIVRRIRNRMPIHRADKEHVHHKLMDMGLGTSQIIAVLYAYTILMGIVAVLWYRIPQDIDVITVLLVWAASIYAFVRVEQTERKRSGRENGHLP